MSMNAILTTVAVILIASGVFLLLTRQWSAQLHERWNQKFSWTRWATGPKAMQASRIANVVVGIALIMIGVAFGLATLVFSV